VLYHPLQYSLARALQIRYEQPLATRRLLKLGQQATFDEATAGQKVDVWYFRPDPHALAEEGGYPREELLELDQLAMERADRTVHEGTDEVLQAQTASLRDRLRQLGVITHRPFVPGARIGRR